MTKLIVAFQNFLKEPKNQNKCNQRFVPSVRAQNRFLKVRDEYGFEMWWDVKETLQFVYFLRLILTYGLVE